MMNSTRVSIDVEYCLRDRDCHCCVVDSANECIVLCFINVARCLSVRAVSVVIMTRKRVCQHFAMFIIQSPTPDNAYGIHVHQMTLYAN